MVGIQKAATPLTRKLLRDLREGWKSFLAIFIICTLAITLYVGIDAAWRGMEKNLNGQFSKSNLADLWVKGEITDRTARDIAALEGVLQTQRRATTRMNAPGLSGDAKVTLMMTDGDPYISKPLLFQGEDLAGAPKNQCVLQDRFALAHGLEVGDTLRLTLEDRVAELTIRGLCMSPEYVVVTDGAELAQSEGAVGYACVSSGSLPYLPYSEVLVTLRPGADLAAVKSAVEALLKDTTLIVSQRKDILGVKMAMEQTGQIRSVGTIFPLVFFIIAVLITWTTMGRLVEKQRLQIGSLCAMGYGRNELIFHYASYGLLLAVSGSLAGFLGAKYGFATILLQFLGAVYVLPGVQPYIFPATMALVSLLMVAITGGAAMLSAVSALQQTPAALLRPKPPGSGKRVFLERIRGLWSRISFSGKMILRNMLRNPVRLMMGMIGALGCSALMLTGFGLSDSMSHVMLSHYSGTMRYDARVALLSDAEPGYGRAVALRAGADAFEEEMIAALEIFTGGDWKMKPVYVLENGQTMIHLEDADKNGVTLPEQGVALSKKAAEEYGYALGDSLPLRLPGGRTVHAPVSQLVELQLDQGVYLSRAAWDQLGLSPWQPTDVLLTGDALDLATVSGMDGVEKVRSIEEERSSNAKNLDIMQFVVLLLVLFSGVLSLVVFYNLGQLNFSERARELATLKVLGFTPQEIKKLVLRENVFITLMGLALGFLAGPAFHRLVLGSALPAAMQCAPYIASFSFVLTAALTVSFALLVNRMLGAKFKEVNMVEALKSVE